jgi:hypothetical protein
MIALITLVIPVGGSAGPFNLYSNTDGYTVAFATNISAAVLQAGYTSNVVPDGTVTIRVISTGICTNSIDIPVNVLPTTSTTSTTTITTTTTTTTTNTDNNNHKNNNKNNTDNNNNNDNNREQQIAERAGSPTKL